MPTYKLRLGKGLKVERSCSLFSPGLACALASLVNEYLTLGAVTSLMLRMGPKRDLDALLPNLNFKDLHIPIMDGYEWVAQPGMS